MARIRTIKPEFWTDEALTECSLNARLLFIGTWNFADDKGNLENSAKQLKMKVFPADSIRVQPLLDELITHGLLIEYSVNDKKYLHIKGFSKHQVINRPSSSAIPLYDDSLSTHGVLSEGREGKGMDKERKGTTKLIAQKTQPPDDWTPSAETALSLSKEFSLPDGGIERYRQSFLDACKAKGYEYRDFDAAFRNCVRQDWPKFRQNGGMKPPKQSLTEALGFSDLKLPVEQDDGIPF